MKHIGCIVIMLSLLAGIVSAQEITVVTEEMIPFNYTENGEAIGLSTEVVKATLDKAGLKAAIKFYPWARAYLMVSEQPNVLIYSMARTPNREELFKWIGPIASMKEVLFKLGKRTDIAIQSLDDAKKYKIGVVRDSGPHQVFLKNGFEEGKQLEVVARGELNMKKLLQGKIDLFAQLEWVAAIEMKKAGLPFNELEVAFTVAQFDLYMAFSKQTPDDVVDRVKKAFEELKAGGFLQTTEEKYRKMYE